MDIPHTDGQCGSNVSKAYSGQLIKQGLKLNLPDRARTLLWSIWDWVRHCLCEGRWRLLMGLTTADRMNRHVLGCFYTALLCEMTFLDHVHNQWHGGTMKAVSSGLGHFQVVFHHYTLAYLWCLPEVPQIPENATVGFGDHQQAPAVCPNTWTAG